MTPSPAPPETPLAFATWIVRRLHESGHQALLAGGCVRDRLLGMEPKDYDVATSATPEQVRTIFGERRTLWIGAAFGVVTVIGPKPLGHVEVATFRCDGEYLDGRHPENVTYSDARNDALRRDFTINGLFWDPLDDVVLDYVGGEDDLKRRVVRAIGHASDRFEEDRLRMLRAVRFATTLQFELDAETASAIQTWAEQLAAISGERISAELVRLCRSDYRGRGWRLLRETKLLPVILPWMKEPLQSRTDQFVELTSHFDQIEPAFGLECSIAVLAAWSLGVTSQLTNDGRISMSDEQDQGNSRAVEPIAERWIDKRREFKSLLQDAVKFLKLSNDSKAIFKAIEHQFETVLKASVLPWSQVQPVIVSDHLDCTLQVLSCLSMGQSWAKGSITHCRQQLQLPPSVLNPPPYFSGTELQAMGIPQGPLLGKLLAELRRYQLDGKIVDSEQAEQWIKQAMKSL